MKTMKIGVVLLALLLAAMAIVPVVSAADATAMSLSPKPAPSIDLNKILLPQLQVNDSQKKIVVNGELSPVKGNTIHEIPEGSIVLHANDGTTRVFDPSGKQILVADDMQAAMVSTPSGMKPATHIHEVPSGSLVFFDGNHTTYVSFHDKIMLTVVDESAQTVDLKTPGLPDRWLEWGRMASAQSIGRFSANWRVPSEPVNKNKGQLIYLFNSIRNDQKIIQPVLTWGRDGVKSWRGAGWAASSSDEYHSTLINVNVGDSITGLMSYSSGAWTITFYDTTTGQTTALGISGYLPTSNVIPDVALEGYNTITDAALPGTTTFSGFVLNNPSGSAITKSVTAGYGDYWINFYRLTKGTNGLNVISSYPYNSVVLHTANP